MSKSNRKNLLRVLRIAICVAALWFVARGVSVRDHVWLQDGTELIGSLTERDGGFDIVLLTGVRQSLPLEEVGVDKQGGLRIAYGLATAWRNSGKSLLLLALLIQMPVGLFQAIRLRWLLGVQDIHVSLWECVKFSFAGNFLNFATPLGSHAGDVFKAYFVTTHTDRKTEAATTIVLDRAIGLAVLLICVALITGLSPSDRLRELRPYMFGMLGFGVAGTIAYLSPGLRRRLIPERWLQRLPMFEHIERIDQAVWKLVCHVPILLGSMFVTVALQFTAMSAYFTLAIAIGLTANLGNVLEYFAYFYTGSIIQALPGPPQGLGTMELAYTIFFEPFGSPSQIVCLAVMIRVMVLTSSLPGALVALTGSYRPRASGQGDQPASESAPTSPDHDLAVS